MKLLNLILTLVFLFNSFSCNTTEPPEDEISPGRRDYEWTVDTLSIPEGSTYPFYMWGTDAGNVWAVGSGYLNAYQIWNFNGNIWSNYVPDKYIDPRGICGFSKNDIWIGSTDGSLWHYDGMKWSKNYQTKIENHKKFNIGWIAGSASDNIYAVGYADSSDGDAYKGIIFHYNGTTWKQVDIESVRFWFNEIFYNKDSDEYLIRAGNFESSESKVFLFNGKYLTEIFSTTSDLAINAVGDKIYITSDKKIFLFEGSGLKLFKDFQNTTFAGLAYGRSKKDFFTMNWDGIGHFNGTDLITIFPKFNDDMAPNQTIVFEKDIFSIWRDTALGITVVIHGKLKN